MRKGPSRQSGTGDACRRGISWPLLAAVLVVAGCRTPPACCDPQLVAREIACRTAAYVEQVPPCRTLIPASVVLEDGLDEDEPVLTALANNSAFQATLAQLGMASGDAVQAQLLANPQLLIYIPTSIKEGAQSIRTAIADLTNKRFDDGDISELETISADVATLPLALLGGVLGVHAAGGVVSLGSLVGFVTVLGIAARNAIMMISHFRFLADVEGVQDRREVIFRGAEERLAPILMTALTTGLALVPLIVTGEIPGQEIEYPMAFVILCGLATGTIVNLFILPILYGLILRGTD